MNQNITFRKALDYKKSIAANIIGFFTKKFLRRHASLQM